MGMQVDLRRNCQTFAKVHVTFCKSVNNGWEFQLLHILPQAGISIYFSILAILVGAKYSVSVHNCVALIMNDVGHLSMSL